MTLLEQLNTLKRLDALILRKATGNTNQLATQLGISRASVYRYLDTLRQLDAPIAYSRCYPSYYYQKEYVLKL